MPCFAEQFAAAAAAVRNFAAADSLSRTLWRAHAAGLIDDTAAQAAAEAIQARRRALAGSPPRTPGKCIGGLPRRSEPRSPDRVKSIARRRRVAMSGAVPAKLAASFTLAENAVLSVVAAEVRRSGTCSLPIDALAALAGTSRSVVKRTVRLAAALGLVAVEYRPQPGRKHLPNVVRIVSRDWRSWLRLGDSGPKPDCHEKQVFKSFRPEPGEHLTFAVRSRHCQRSNGGGGGAYGEQRNSGQNRSLDGIRRSKSSASE